MTTSKARARKTGDRRKLKDLESVGPATLREFELLAITSVRQLAACDARELYTRLCAITGVDHDPCCEDVFNAAVAQARDPELPAEQRRWWYWSRRRRG